MHVQHAEAPFLQQGQEEQHNPGRPDSRGRPPAAWHVDAQEVWLQNVLLLSCISNSDDRFVGILNMPLPVVDGSCDRGEILGM